MNNKDIFIKLALECQVLQFGNFKLKSGRESPYFFNAGLFYDGQALREVGRCYAQLLIDHDIHCPHLFGPAYKGLPLATATAIALAEAGISAKVSFNRKESKDHGEGGVIIGAPLNGDIVIIDDVITAGTAYRQAVQLIESHAAQVKTVVIALDRCERGMGALSTLDEIKTSGVAVFSIINLYDLIDYLDRHHARDKAEILRNYLKN